MKKDAVSAEAPAPKTPPAAGVSSYAQMQMKMRSMTRMIDVQQNFMERLMQGPIGEKVRIEYVEEINELERHYRDDSEGLVALSPKAGPGVQASRPHTPPPQASYCFVYLYADVALHINLD